MEKKNWDIEAIGEKAQCVIQEKEKIYPRLGKWKGNDDQRIDTKHSKTRQR